jgi:hypothetical protein
VCARLVSGACARLAREARAMRAFICWLHAHVGVGQQFAEACWLLAGGRAAGNRLCRCRLCRWHSCMAGVTRCVIVPHSSIRLVESNCRVNFKPTHAS